MVVVYNFLDEATVFLSDIKFVGISGRLVYAGYRSVKSVDIAGQFDGVRGFRLTACRE